MNWQDLCSICCIDRQAFWDKVARQVSIIYCFMRKRFLGSWYDWLVLFQLQRYRVCSNGECFEGTIARKHRMQTREGDVAYVITVHTSFIFFADWEIADGVRPIPGQQADAMGDTDMFLFIGFMIVPILFVLYGTFQRMEQRRNDLSQVDLLSPLSIRKSNGSIFQHKIRRSNQHPPLPPLD